MADVWEGRARLEARTELGTLVAYVTGDGRDDPGIGVDLVTESGTLQLSTTEVVSSASQADGRARARTWSWDGIEQDAASVVEAAVSSDSYYYTDRERPAAGAEDKAGLVAMLGEALAMSDPRRYGFLRERPLVFEGGPASEKVRCGTRAVNVTGDSPTALLRDVLENWGEIERGASEARAAHRPDVAPAPSYGFEHDLEEHLEGRDVCHCGLEPEGRCATLWRGPRDGADAFADRGLDAVWTIMAFRDEDAYSSGDPEWAETFDISAEEGYEPGCTFDADGNFSATWERLVEDRARRILASHGEAAPPGGPAGGTASGQAREAAINRAYARFLRSACEEYAAAQGGREAAAVGRFLDWVEGGGARAEEPSFIRYAEAEGQHVAYSVDAASVAWLVGHDVAPEELASVGLDPDGLAWSLAESVSDVAEGVVDAWSLLDYVLQEQGSSLEAVEEAVRESRRARADARGARRPTRQEELDGDLGAARAASAAAPRAVDAAPGRGL